MVNNMSSKDVSISKRTQVSASNRVMFLWVAGVSVVFGFALVGGIFLTQMLMFNERVLQEKDKTISTLKLNNKNITILESNIRAIDTNQALIDAKAKPEDQAVQVILDALPSDFNPLALGASLQNRLLADFSVDSLKIDDANTSIPASGAVQTTASGQNQISFSFAISGTEADFQKALVNLEKSIRTIDVTMLNIENGKLNIQARAFYEPARIVELKDKTVK